MRSSSSPCTIGSGYLLASDDGAMTPAYDVSTINGKVMGFGEPLRVKQGQRILLHVLNSSPTEVHWIALAGHALRVVALDGNPVPRPQTVPMLCLASGERVCAIVQMNTPGVWVLGEVRKHVQAAGMAIVVEYANATGAPKWHQPPNLVWNYEQFAASQSADQPANQPCAGPPSSSRSSSSRSSTATAASSAGPSTASPIPTYGIAPLRQGRRYRLQFIKNSNDDHPLHLHRHSFELCSWHAARR